VSGREPGGRLAALLRGARRVRAALTAALADPASLSGRILTSGVTRMGGHAASQGIRLASNLIMTRLLAPEAFGLMGVVFSIQAGLMLMTDIGIGQAVVRSPNGEKAGFLQTAWTLRLAKHVLVTALIAALAALLGVAATRLDFGQTVYADPQMPWLLAAAGLVITLRGCESINLAVAERRMVIGRLVTIELVGQTVGVAAMLALALAQPSVWALIFGAFATSATRVALSHLAVTGPAMRFRLDRRFTDEIWTFGKWLMASSMFSFFARQGDRLILGALMTPREFGYYVVARLWIDAASLAIGRVWRPIALASFSEVARTRPGDLGRVFRRIRLGQNVMCAGAFAAFALGGPLLAATLYTEAFAPVGPLMAALAPFMLFQAYTPINALLLSAGDSRTFAQITVLQSVAVMGMTPLAYVVLGPPWALLVVATGLAWGTPRQIALAARLTPLSTRRELAMLAALLALSAATTLTALGAW
jgi:O-antigen/teichoic acid export membrane protein